MAVSPTSTKKTYVSERAQHAALNVEGQVYTRFKLTFHYQCECTREHMMLQSLLSLDMLHSICYSLCFHCYSESREHMICWQ